MTEIGGSRVFLFSCYTPKSIISSQGIGRYVTFHRQRSLTRGKLHPSSSFFRDSINDHRKRKVYCRLRSYLDEAVIVTMILFIVGHTQSLQHIDTCRCPKIDCARGRLYFTFIFTLQRHVCFSSNEL